MSLKGTVTNLDNPRIRFLNFFSLAEKLSNSYEHWKKNCTEYNAVHACAYASAALP